MANYNKVFSRKVYLYYYWFQRIIAWFVYDVLFRCQIEGQENIDFEKGKFLVLANHCSHMDPPLVGYAVPRPIAYMAKEELFKIPLLKTLIHCSGAYSVNRGVKDRSFIDNTIFAMNNGWVVTIFPEGGRSYDGHFMGAKIGTAKILLAAKVPFLPVALINTHQAWGKKKKIKFFTPIKVKIGKMVNPEEYLPEDHLSEEEKINLINQYYQKKLIELLPSEHQPLVV